ncbi:hypothetical protein GH733_012466 [Mirounga leonina]|nr:hypothetical protein GH733_012466 [Mirounga leonina]
MAQRLLMRWAPLNLQGSADPTVQSWWPDRNTWSSLISIHTTRVSTVTFNIQGGPDFQDENQCLWISMHGGVVPAGFFPLGPRLEKMVSKQHGKVIMTKYEMSAVPQCAGHQEWDMMGKFVGIRDQQEGFLKKLIG